MAKEKRHKINKERKKIKQKTDNFGTLLALLERIASGSGENVELLAERQMRSASIVRFIFERLPKRLQFAKLWLARKRLV